MAASSSEPHAAHILISGAIIGACSDPVLVGTQWFTAEDIDDEGGRYTFWEGDRLDLALDAASLWAAGRNIPIVNDSGVSDDGAQL